MQLKILLITYKALHNLAPSNLTGLLHQHTPTRNLRSADPPSSPLSQMRQEKTGGIATVGGIISEVRLTARVAMVTGLRSV